MLQRLRFYSEVCEALVAEDQVMRALDFALYLNVKGIRMSLILENVD